MQLNASSGVAVVTGTTHGIGRVTACGLVGAGFPLVMLCRDLDAGRSLQEMLVADHPGARVSLVHCDLASLASVRRAAGELRVDGERIALLVNNAGMVSARHRMSEDGYELTFATNHLGPFLLTRLLLDRMSPAGRIVNLASRAHYRGRLDLARLRDPRAAYNGIAAYAQSKLANVLFTFALARRLAGTLVTANCVHPGIVATNLLPRWLRAVKPFISRVMFDAQRGARSSLWLALAPEAAALNGCYVDESQAVQPAAALARDVELQELLWTTSERWTGLVPGT